MMVYIEAPTTVKGLPWSSVFLGGGITDCPDWQSKVVDGLRDLNIILYNPRRENFPIEDPNAAEAQIKWEFEHLRKSDALIFWFPKESLCPIVLYELGAWSMTDKPLFVGTDPEYKRRQDVEIQTRLARPDVSVAYDLNSVVEMVRLWSRSG
jgi:hypothetical protein